MFEFQDIIKSANIYLTAKDKNFKYLYCNENFAYALGFDSPKKLIGKTDYDLFKDNIADIYRSGDICVLKGGTLFNVPEIQPQINKTINILTTKNNLKNEKGDLVGVVVSFVDVTGLTYTLPADIMQYDHKSKSYKFQIGKQVESFTIREYQIFKKILTGLSMKQIAKQINLSPRTVEDYVDNIKYKLQCTNKHHIIEAAMRLGIVQQNIMESSS